MRSKTASVRIPPDLADRLYAISYARSGIPVIDLLIEILTPALGAPGVTAALKIWLAAGRPRRYSYTEKRRRYVTA